MGRGIFRKRDSPMMGRMGLEFTLDLRGLKISVWQAPLFGYGWRLANGGRSSMVELQIVILAVAGSSPVGHPTRDFGMRISECGRRAS